MKPPRHRHQLTSYLLPALLGIPFAAALILFASQKTHTSPASPAPSLAAEKKIAPHPIPASSQPTSSSLPQTPYANQPSNPSTLLSPRPIQTQRDWEIALAGSLEEKLAAALTILAEPNHPLRREALRLLQRYLGGDFGDNPETLRSLVLQKLQADDQIAAQIRQNLATHRQKFQNTSK